MSYKYSSGSVRRGDIYYEDDREGQPTYIDFDQDTITLRPSGSQILHAQADAVGIGTTSPDYTLHVAGNMSVDQYIYHNGDSNTHINFVDDKIVLKAGNKAMVTMEEKGNAPHEVTINDGSNNIDFVVKGNGSGQGNPGMKFDASTNRLGVNGVGEPDKALHVGGNVKLDGTEPTIFFADDTAAKAEIGINNSDNIVIENKTINKHIVFKVNDQGAVKEGLRLDGAVPEVVVNQASDSLVDFRVESNNQTHMLFVDGSADKVGIGISAPDATLHVHSDSINNGALLISQADNSTDASQLDLSKARGSGASPATVQNNDFLGQIRFLAYDGNSYDNFADIFARAAGTISTTSHPTKIVMRTTKSSATSPTTAVTIDESQNVIVEGNLEVKDQITIRDQNAPASASANGFRGEIRYDSNYIYVCVADNTWKRVALSSW